jgi:hypothetical protein
VAAIHFGWEDDLEAVYLPAGQRGGLPGSRFSFLEISPPCVILTGMRAADEGGIVFRLWNAGGEAVTALIDVGRLGTFIQAWRCDLLETPTKSLEMEAGRIELPMVGHGLGAVVIR